MSADTIEVDRVAFFEKEKFDPAETVVVTISYRGKEYRSIRTVSRQTVILKGYEAVIDQASEGAVKCIKEALVTENLISKEN